MPVYYMDERPHDGWYAGTIPNGRYRYIGRHLGIRFEVHAITPKTKEQIYEMIENNMEGWINREGYITELN
ncbi:hypothetical protein CW357_00990 [Rummeliibacillus sp. TYF005]|uniref:hypothetical protein n=1 Tax=Rummeliibacillus sp. TYF005 TaxID=2058214 RepID=UPI000F5284DD|nr:hypothetical protein [Rummeliibacillus sp. TYF005]RPJ97272.1 hypothetical protein CW357_00990 [Rummeliibacillus sp. TYF005]